MLAVFRLNSNMPEAPVPTVKELHAALLLIDTVLPFGINTLSVAVGTPDGLQTEAVLHLPLAIAVLVGV